MTATPAYSIVAAKAALDSLLGKLNVSTAGHIKIFTGTAPTDVETADSGTLLSTLTLSTTAFAASVADGTIGAKATANAITSDTSAAATGTAGYFRAYDSTGTCVVQGNVGTSAADMIISSTTITAGDTVACTSWVVHLPNGGA
jgi:hypothetical protein